MGRVYSKARQRESKMKKEKEKKQAVTVQHTRRAIQAWKPDVRKLGKYGSEVEFMKFLRETGIKDEDPRFALAVNAFRAYQRGTL